MTKLNQIRKLLGQEIKLEQMKLENGVVIEAEVFEAGQNVFVLSENERIPLPPGEYQLEDGNILSVVEEGVIATIGAAEATEEIENQDMEQEESKPKKVVESITKEEHFNEDEKQQFSDETIDVLAEKVFNKLEERLESYTIAAKEKEVDEKVEEEVKEQLAAVEQKEIEIVKHTPEQKVTTEPMKFGTKRIKTVKDRVFDKMFA